ncbi:hypothetical protein I350_01690 [Cryptococcus amylolentus CBS 6273]|uniref:Uncharacterized protein n=1 Tax=Cryptococcus amylolentus CBS 6273 TaxID=1296118 RepID=A0A1E3KDB3_9TREE|nr:hypothetical protein I350_01690 [Cryptococcus amylolentus CBS 6273]
MALAGKLEDLKPGFEVNESGIGFTQDRIKVFVRIPSGGALPVSFHSLGALPDTAILTCGFALEVRTPSIVIIEGLLEEKVSVGTGPKTQPKTKRQKHGAKLGERATLTRPAYEEAKKTLGKQELRARLLKELDERLLEDRDEDMPKGRVPLAGGVNADVPFHRRQRVADDFEHIVQIVAMATYHAYQQEVFAFTMSKHPSDKDRFCFATPGILAFLEEHEEFPVYELFSTVIQRILQGCYVMSRTQWGLAFVIDVALRKVSTAEDQWPDLSRDLAGKGPKERNKVIFNKYLLHDLIARARYDLPPTTDNWKSLAFNPDSLAKSYGLGLVLPTSIDFCFEQIRSWHKFNQAEIQRYREAVEERWIYYRVLSPDQAQLRFVAGRRRGSGRAGETRTNGSVAASVVSRDGSEASVDVGTAVGDVQSTGEEEREVADGVDGRSRQ